MGYPLSTKLDATLRYASGLYGLGLAVLADIAAALANAAAAQTAATAAQTGLSAHTGTGGTAHAAASGSAAGFMSAAHYTRVAGVEDGAQAVTEARVRAALAAAAAAVSFNAQKISSVADPTSSQDAATKAYVDAVATGLDAKPSVRLIDTVGVSLSGTQTVDGVATAPGDRVLRAVGSSALNGIYVANNSGAWPRATDADSSAEVSGGMFTFVTEGTAYADTGWVLITNDAITLGTTALQFTQFSSAGVIINGNGLAKSGNTLSVQPADASLNVSSSGVKLAYLGSTAEVADGASSDGTSAYAAHSDHAHAHGNRAGGTLHAQATAAVDGFLAAADKVTINKLAAGQALTLGRVTVDCILESPTLLTGTGTISVDSAVKNDFLLVLGGATTLNFVGHVAGRQGNIWVKQDATGSRSLAFQVAEAAPGGTWTQLKDSGVADLTPAQPANALTMYSYAMFTLGGVNYVQLAKSVLS